MMGEVKCFTSFSLSYLSRAVILARTTKAAHPDWEVWAVIVDKPPDGFDAPAAIADFDDVIYASDLGFECFEAWLFKHDVVEACTAVKARMMRHLLEMGADKIIYLDPDIAVFHPLTSILAHLDESSIVLTPHQIEPNVDRSAVNDNEVTSLLFGVFNLGFIAVRNDSVGRRFCEWWEQQLWYDCYDDVHRGIFTDQKWCDLVPALFPKVHVERDHGCNVASWNLSTRRIEFMPTGEILVNGDALKFYHFTKMNSVGDIMTDKYAGDRLEVIEIWRWYKRTLGNVSVGAIPKGYWYYSSFDNGVKIPKAARVLFRSRLDLQNTFSNPFSTSSHSYFRWLESEAGEVFATSGDQGFLPV